MYSTSIELWEILMVPLYLLVPLAMILFFPSVRDRKLFSLGLTARLLGAIAYTMIYLFYYGGGDTIAYYQTAIPFVNMLIQEPSLGVTLLFESYSPENYAHFTQDTGYPLTYIYSGRDTFMVSKLITPLLLLSFKSYFLCSILIASITFFGPWKLYILFRTLAPSANRIALFSALLFPSVLFWGSGISKDTITYASVCYLIYGFYFTLIRREVNMVRIGISLLTIYLIVIIKPYVFLVLFPGAIIWYFFGIFRNIQNRILRVSVIPFILALSLAIFAFTYSSISQLLGDYSTTEKIIEKAVVSQEDLKRDYYGGNTFDIGTIEPTLIGVLSKFPSATFYGFYGPTLIHVNNIVMFFSAIENTLFLLLTFMIFVFRNPIKSIQYIGKHPFLIFCITFSLFLAFAIGLTTPNFGALVRFKIPLIPFFCFFLLIIYYRKPIES